MRFSLSSFAVLAAVLIGTVAAAPAPSDFAVKKAQGLRLLELEDSAEPVWKSEAEKLDLMRAKTPFVSDGLYQNECCLFC
jgi:bacterial leucyl aminopeptidase